MGIAFVILLFGGFFVIYFIRLYNVDIKPDIEESRRKKTEKYAAFSDSTLTLKERSADLQKVVKLEAEKDDYLGTTETKVICTSATVGGVTTGGFDTVGGKTYVERGSNTGKYKLTYQGYLINKIKLTDELYRQALESPIKQYLVENEKTIRINQPVSMSGNQLNISMGMSIQEKQNMILREGRKGFPDYTKASAIYKWICNS